MPVLYTFSLCNGDHSQDIPIAPSCGLTVGSFQLNLLRYVVFLLVHAVCVLYLDWFMCNLSEMYYSRTCGMPFSWFSSFCMHNVILSVSLLHKVVPINFCLYVVCQSWLTRLSPGYLLLYQSYLLETSCKLKSFLLPTCSFYFPSSHTETNWTIRSSLYWGAGGMRTYGCFTQINMQAKLGLLFHFLKETWLPISQTLIKAEKI